MCALCAHFGHGTSVWHSQVHNLWDSVCPSLQAFPNKGTQQAHKAPSVCKNPTPPLARNPPPAEEQLPALTCNTKPTKASDPLWPNSVAQWCHSERLNPTTSI